jgi:hypothetical protein
MNILLKSVGAAASGARPYGWHDRRSTRLAQATRRSLVQGLAVANLDAVVGQFQRLQDRGAAARRDLQGAARPGRDPRRQLRSPASSSRWRQVQRIAPRPTRTSRRSQQQANDPADPAAGQQELQQPSSPVAMSRSLCQEQIQDKLDQAIKNAMAKKKISLLIRPDAVVAVNNNAYNLNQDILNELNTLLPSAQLVPPTGWEPREVARGARRQRRARPRCRRSAARRCDHRLRSRLAADPASGGNAMSEDAARQGGRARL